jgi:ribosomal protein S27E
MPEKKVLRLTCPVCETRLRVSEGIERFACLNCGAELTVEQVGGEARVALTQASAARLSDSQQQLIEVNSALKTADDSYGVGCAIATMGITLVACIILALAIVTQSQPLFWGAIAVALVMLGFVLFMFLTASSRGTDPLLRKRDRLQAQFETEQDTAPAPVTGAEEPASEALEPLATGEIEQPVEPPIEPPAGPPVEPLVEPPAEPSIEQSVEPSAEQPVESPGELPEEPPVKPLVKPIQPPKQNRSEPLG